MSWYWIICVILVLIALIVYEYLDHDCINNKPCYQRTPSPDKSSSEQEIIFRLQTMLRNDLDFVTWRQSLIGALGVGILVGIFLYSRFPTPFELFFVGIIVFMGIYFSLSWMRAHYHAPNVRQIERGLSLLQDKL